MNNTSIIQIVYNYIIRKGFVSFYFQSRPGSHENRRAIRKTWLKSEVWAKLKILIRPIFIIGKEDFLWIQPEELIYDDILEIDVPESHYNLPMKDIAWVRTKHISRSFNSFGGWLTFYALHNWRFLKFDV